MLSTLILFALSAQVPPAPPAPPSAMPLPVPPPPPSPPEPPVGFDADGDGTITRQEFVAPLNDAFTRLDEDGDGHLSREEFSSGDRHVHVITRSNDGPGIHRFQMRRDAEDAERTFVIVDGHGPAEVRTERRIEIRREGD